jgi:polar amino acid transport system substrate-binding protein
MGRRERRPTASAATLVAALLAVLPAVLLVGCGGSSSKSATPPVTSPGSTGGESASVASLVPAQFRSKGTITVASYAGSPPNEFFARDGHTVIGMDPDLVKALGQVMGLKVNVVSVRLAAIIPGLAAAKYDMGASSFTDTKAREKAVDFVTYFTAGESFFTKASGGTAINAIADLCGHTVSVETGTAEQADATTQSGRCTRAGKKPVTVLQFPDQNGVNLALAGGRAQLGFAASPVAAYQVKESNGQFKLAGPTFASAPYGLAFPKRSGLVQPTLAALKALIASGTYMSILTKWGIQAGAIQTPMINGATG